MRITENLEKFDIIAKVHGGGRTGQAEALRLAISRALLEAEPHLKKILKSHFLLTRDARAVESKRVGGKKARRPQQFSKR